MTVGRDTYPLLEIGRSVCQDRVIVHRADLAAAVTGVRALHQGFSFRLSIIADHELDHRWFGFDRATVDDGLDLWLQLNDTARTIAPVHLQRGGGGAGRYEFDFWAPPIDAPLNDTRTATIVVSWPGEDLAPTPVALDLDAIEQARADIVEISGAPIQYP